MLQKSKISLIIAQHFSILNRSKRAEKWGKSLMMWNSMW